MSLKITQYVEAEQRRRALLLSSFRRDHKPTRTDLINLARALIFGEWSQYSHAALKDQREMIAHLITQAVAEGDIVEVPLAQPGCCRYRLRQGEEP